MGTWRTFDVRGGEEIRRHELLRAAIAAGIALFDSSPMYGEAERVLGEAIAASGTARDDVIVADKVWADDAAEARQQIDRALTWYGGRVDIYQIHNLLAWREHLPVLERLREEGRVRVIGATHYAHSAFGDLLQLMRTGRIGQIQIPYNAVDRAVEEDVLPAAADLGIGVLVMRPFGEGALLRRAPTATQLAPLAPFGVRSWSDALLKWILSDPRVHCAIPATRDTAHARDNAAAGTPPWMDADARSLVVRLAAARN